MAATAFVPAPALSSHSKRDAFGVCLRHKVDAFPLKKQSANSQASRLPRASIKEDFFSGPKDPGFPRKLTQTIAFSSATGLLWYGWYKVRSNSFPSTLFSSRPSDSRAPLFAVLHRGRAASARAGARRALRPRSLHARSAADRICTALSRPLDCLVRSRLDSSHPIHALPPHQRPVRRAQRARAAAAALGRSARLEPDRRPARGAFPRRLLGARARGERGRLDGDASPIPGDGDAERPGIPHEPAFVDQSRIASVVHFAAGSNSQNLFTLKCVVGTLGLFLSPMEVERSAVGIIAIGAMMTCRAFP